MHEYNKAASGSLIGLGDSGALAQGLAAQQFSKAERDTPPLLRTVDELRRAQDIARDRLEELASRLEPLLAAPVPEPCGNEATSRPSSSPLDSMLMERVGSAQGMDYRIGNLLRRLSI